MTKKKCLIKFVINLEKLKHQGDGENNQNKNMASQKSTKHKNP